MPQKNPKTTMSDSVEDDEQCLHCYDFCEEGWASCIVCERWALNSCAGIDSENNVCVLCESRT